MTRNKKNTMLYGSEAAQPFATFLEAANDPTDAVNLLDMEMDTVAAPAFLRYGRNQINHTHTDTDMLLFLSGVRCSVSFPYQSIARTTA